MPYTWINIDAGHGLVPANTKPWPEPILTIHTINVGLWHSLEGSFTESSISKISVEIMLLKLLPYLPEVK